ncbi:MAG: phosphoadenylyl-sulfate reductase [Hyphomicrobiaceae bacterium]|nr:phosphoadenylyl-sulfate reductase [Hyphomicrobiaceae bacterium]
MLSPANNSGLITALDDTLANTIELPERLATIRRALPGRIAFSTSLGIEDQAVLHAIHVSGIGGDPANGIDVFTLDTGRHFPETLDTLEASDARYGLPIRVVAPDAAEVEALVARDGINGFRSSIANRKSCCDVRKVRPLNRALSGASGWVTGLRREQSIGRGTIPFAALDGATGLIKLNPLADWTLARLEAYVEANAIPVNALHARGYPSIGCQPCTRAVRPGEDIRAGRWWWEGEAAAAALDGQECGLHNNPNRPKPAAASATSPVPPTQPEARP